MRTFRPPGVLSPHAALLHSRLPVDIAPLPGSNPFAALTLIAAPAVLTNASSILIMSTSNRLARAVDRARALTQQLEATKDFGTAFAHQQLSELASAERRSLMLIQALRSFYVALSGFAAAALISLIGAVVVPQGPEAASRTIEIVAVLAGLLAVGGIINGSVLLVRETRIAVGVLRERADSVRIRAAHAHEIPS